MERIEFSKKVRAEAFLRCGSNCELDDAVRKSLSYDHKTGGLTWTRTNLPASSINNKGYGRVKVMKKTLSAHRVAWFLHYGEWPAGGVIDHINGNKTDNRIENLRVVTTQQNGRNRKLNENSKSGYPGVYWACRQKAWKVYIRREGRNIHLGYFKNKTDAAEARKSAERADGYSPSHGRAGNA
ncbi:HNH endonuclease protein [Rhizobium phage RHph_Y1_10]|nr:HNH endonuclease protein [Rhizobium phage RHph_Y1_10]